MFEVKHISQVKIEVYRRIGHIALPYKHFVIIWGGYEGSSTFLGEYCPANIIWFYNCLTELWTCCETRGDQQCANSGCTGLVNQNFLYVFGGMKRLEHDHWRYSNGLARLNLETLTWETLTPTGIIPLTCDKGAGWVHNNKLYFFGGYGLTPSRQMREDPCCDDYNFITDTDDHFSNKGWNNQFVCYDPATNELSWVKSRNACPPPRAAHACDINGDTVVMFGGRLRRVRFNELYLFDMKTKTWTGNVTINIDIPAPGVSWHSLNFVSRTTIIVYGGLDTAGDPSTVWWVIKMNSGFSFEWKRHEMLSPLVWHKAAFIPDTKELVIVGGVAASPHRMRDGAHMTNHILLYTEPRSLLRECLQVLCKQEGKDLLLANWKEFNSSLPSMLFSELDNRIKQGTDTKLKILYSTV